MIFSNIYSLAITAGHNLPKIKPFKRVGFSRVTQVQEKDGIRSKYLEVLVGEAAATNSRNLEFFKKVSNLIQSFCASYQPDYIF